MRSSRSSLGPLFALLGAAAAGPAVPSTARMFTRSGISRRYPEQSTRQQSRGARRAQGGPGLMFDEQMLVWVPRPQGIAVERPHSVPF